MSSSSGKSKVQDIAWSNQSYLLRDVVGQWTFPKIVKITKGYLSPNENECLKEGQILRLHEIQAQRRVVAFDKKKKKYYSIPLRFGDAKFQLIGSGAPSGPGYLRQILDKGKLPMDVRLEEDNERTIELRLQTASKNKEGFSFSALTLKNTYDMRYVQGNHIIENHLDTMVVNIPFFAPVEVKLAEGFMTGTPEKWQRYQILLSKLVAKNVSFRLSPGYTHITYFNDKRLDKAKSQEQFDQIQPVGSVIVASSRLKSPQQSNGDIHTMRPPPPGIMKKATSETNLHGPKPPLQRMSTVESPVSSVKRTQSPDRWSQGVPDQRQRQQPSIRISSTLPNPHTNGTKPVVYNPSVTMDRSSSLDDAHDYYILRNRQQMGDYPSPDYGGSLSSSFDSGGGYGDDTGSENSFGSSRTRPNNPPPPPPVNTIPNLPGESDRRSSVGSGSIPPAPPAPPAPPMSSPARSQGGPPPPEPPPPPGPGPPPPPAPQMSRSGALKPPKSSGPPPPPAPPPAPSSGGAPPPPPPPPQSGTGPPPPPPPPPNATLSGGPPPPPPAPAPASFASGGSSLADSIASRASTLKSAEERKLPQAPPPSQNSALDFTDELMSRLKGRTQGTDIEAMIEQGKKKRLSQDHGSTMTLRQTSQSGAPPPVASRPASNGHIPQARRGSFASLGEVPLDLNGLSIAQVGECLHLLNMDMYIKKFKDDNINGEMLAELSSDMLVKDLGMTGLTAIKLIKFVNGWRPT